MEHKTKWNKIKTRKQQTGREKMGDADPLNNGQHWSQERKTVSSDEENFDWMELLRWKLQQAQMGVA